MLIVGEEPVALEEAIDRKMSRTSRIVVSKPSLVRREQIAKYCDVALEPGQRSIADDCRDMTKAAVSVVLNCVGAMSGLRVGIGAVRHCGTYVNVVGRLL